MAERGGTGEREDGDVERIERAERTERTEREKTETERTMKRTGEGEDVGHEAERTAGQAESTDKAAAAVVVPTRFRDLTHLRGSEASRRTQGEIWQGRLALLDRPKRTLDSLLRRCFHICGTQSEIRKTEKSDDGVS